MFRKGSAGEPRRPGRRREARRRRVLPFSATPGGQPGRMINILASLFFRFSSKASAV